MTLKIYNSLTSQKEDFKPLEAGRVKMYVCGPTVYDEPHIGHLRSAYVFEIIRRHFKTSGYKVTFVRNVTDVDDKIIEKAKESSPKDLNLAVQQVSDKYLAMYTSALFELMGDCQPDTQPRATAHVPQMLELVEALIAQGYAYITDGDVFFEVDKFAPYGKLSHQKKDRMLEGVRVDAREKKKNPLDFALWKKSKEGEPSWDSPWGKGRPGWHIECSAMSTNYLGETFDIHGGGLDLKFPHHENEIAQSEAKTGKPFVRVWVHHGLIAVNGQKMSKSLKNYLTLGEVKKKYADGEELLKLLFLNTHYQAPLDYSDERMEMQKAIFRKFHNFFDTLKQLNSSAQDSEKKTDGLLKMEEGFKQAMEDDFNTPLAFSKLQEMMHFAWKSKEAAIMISAGEKIKKLGSESLSLFTGADSHSFFDPHSRSRNKGDSRMDEELRPEIEKRDQARLKQDFKTADQIRERLQKEYGIELMDWADGRSTWRRHE